MGIMMMSLVVGKMIITLILDGLFQGKLSNLIIGILMKMNLSQAEADVIYQNIFRANRDVFQWIGFMLLFLVGYYAALSKTANYLKNIGEGSTMFYQIQNSRSSWKRNWSRSQKN